MSTDNLTSSWLPDTHFVYGDKLEELGMCDTRTIMHLQRFFFSNNDLDPKIYQVTKITDLNPQGIIKLSIKQDELNEKRDNIELHVCDYYSNEGDIRIEAPENLVSDDEKTSRIDWFTVDEYGELVDSIPTKLDLGTTYYFGVKFSNDNIDPQWRIDLIGDYSDEDKEYYIGLMKLTKFDNTILALKPAKASSLKGKVFNLWVSDINDDYKSCIGLEVSE
jgi:hypothetical protein